MTQGECPRIRPILLSLFSHKKPRNANIDMLEFYYGPLNSNKDVVKYNYIVNRQNSYLTNLLKKKVKTNSSQSYYDPNIFRRYTTKCFSNNVF